MTEPKTIRVKYVGNADPRNPASSIVLSGRPTVEVDGEGEVTAEELSVLRDSGLLLDVVDSDESSRGKTEDPPSTAGASASAKSKN
jgi:hypothetical protein